MTHPKDLRSLRLALGIPQSELARLLGVSPTTISRWERGEVPIDDPEEIFARLREIGSRLRPEEST